MDHFRCRQQYIYAYVGPEIERSLAQPRAQRRLRQLECGEREEVMLEQGQGLRESERN